MDTPAQRKLYLLLDMWELEARVASAVAKPRDVTVPDEDVALLRFIGSFRRRLTNKKLCEIWPVSPKYISQIIAGQAR